MYTPRAKVLWFAAASRAFLVAAQAAFNALIPDHNAHVFASPRDPALATSALDRCVEALLGGLARWDAQHFLHVAQYGYTYENCLAFFPLFPLALRYSAHALARPLGALLNYRSALLVCATLLNAACFVRAADALYALTRRVLKSESLAYKAAVLFCVNPASVFFTACYSESMFAWLTFSGMLACTAERETLRFTNVDILSGVPMSLSMVTRSNGALNLGFVVYATAKNVVEKTLPEIAHRYRTIRYRALVPLLALPLIASVMALTLTLVVAALPFALVQTYNYYKFCVHHEHNLPQYLAEGEWVLPGQAKSEWCNSTVPMAYSYVQRHYWDVGFLNYYQWKQIPNFLLAAPMLYIITVNCWRFVRQHPSHCARLGMNVNRFRRTTSVDSAGSKSRKSIKIVTEIPSYDPDMFVYVVHGMALVVFGALFIHIQVVTRLLASASPLLYWFAAMKIKSQPSRMTEQNHINEHFRKIGNHKLSGDYFSITNLEGIGNMHSKWRTFILSRNISDRNFKLIKLYFLGYFIIGTICFCNFYPWT